MQRKVTWTRDPDRIWLWPRISTGTGEVRTQTQKDPKSVQLVATHTSDGNERKITDTDTTNSNYPHKLILNRIIPNIIPGAICLIDHTITEDVAGIVDTLDTRQKILSKEIFMDAARSSVHIFQNSKEVISTGRDGTTSRDGKTVIAAARLTSPIQFFHSTTDSQAGIGTKISSIQ